MSGLAVQAGIPLAPRTTLGVGGPARYFVEVRTEEELCAAFGWSERNGLPLFVLGGGSNLLVADDGLEALVVRLSLRGMDVVRDGTDAEVRVAAGEVWDGVVARAVEADLAGLECLSGIPGDAGATPIQNVGAYGQEVSDTIARVDVVERSTALVRSLGPDACSFRYRDSIFKGEARGRWVVTRVVFRLRAGGAPHVRYAELERALGDAPRTLRAVRETVIALRRGKGMVLDPNDPNTRSAGSFFTNPIVPDADAIAVADRARAAGVLAAGEAMPCWPADAGRTKLSAAWLIERAGFARGTARGRAAISERHSLALVNRGGATAAEIVALALEVKLGVLERFGVRLRPEPELVGFEPGAVADLVT